MACGRIPFLPQRNSKRIQLSAMMYHFHKQMVEVTKRPNEHIPIFTKKEANEIQYNTIQYINYQMCIINFCLQPS